MKHYVWFIVTMTILLGSCDPDVMSLPIVADSEAYYPLQVGRYIEYQVDSIVFDDAPGGNSQDTVSFFLREEIASFYAESPADTVYHVHRQRRSTMNDPWVLTDVWSVRLEENRILRTEENLIFHKMTFPLYKGQRWNSTAYIPAETQVRIGTETMEPYQFWDARILSTDEAGEAGEFSFPGGHLLRIRQVDEDDDLFKRYVHETYARGIGLVARIDTILDSRCIELGDFTPCIGKPWTNHASKGYILSQVITAHN